MLEKIERGEKNEKIEKPEKFENFGKTEKNEKIAKCEKSGKVKKMKMTIAIIENGAIRIKRTRPSGGTEYFDHALKLTKFGKFNYFIIFICGLILANVLLETLGISFVLPVSQCDLRLSIQQRGILSAIGFVGIITSSYAWGFLADTTGRRTVIRPTLLIGFFITIVSSFAQNFWILVILRFLNGICISGGSATVYAYLSEFHTTKHRSRAIMGSAIIFGIGAMLMPAIAWLVINQEWRLEITFINLIYKPWRLFIVVCGLPGLFCGLALFKIPESPKFLMSQGCQEKALNILRNIYHINTGKPREQYPVSYIVEDLGANLQVKEVHTTSPIKALLCSMWYQTQPLFGRKYIRATILICIIQFFIFVTSNGMYMWFPHVLNSVAEFLKDNPDKMTNICTIIYEKQQSLLKYDVPVGFLENTGSAAYSTEVCNEKLEIATYEHSLVLEIMYAVGFAVIALIINTTGKRCILFICLGVCGACGIATVFVNIPWLAVDLYLILLLCGLGINVLSAATVDIFPTKLRAMAVCISLMMGRLGSVVGANIFGALMTNNCKSAFVISGASLILSGLLGFLIPKPSIFTNRIPSRRSSIASMTGN